MMKKSISIFPIPGTVALPGTIIPLHIFEPRYRQMFLEASSLGGIVALGLPEQTLSRSIFGASKDPNLLKNKNLDRYRSHRVVCGGPVAINGTFDDGRLLVEVVCQSVFKVLEYTQEEPYYKAKVREVDLGFDEFPEGQAHSYLKQFVEVASEFFDPKVFAPKTPFDKMGRRQLLSHLQCVMSCLLFSLKVSEKKLQDFLELATISAQSEMVHHELKTRGYLPLKKMGKLLHVDFGLGRNEAGENRDHESLDN